MIRRRRLVALVSVIALAAIGLVGLIAGLVVTRTSYGEDQLRKLIQAQLAGAIRGKVYIGPISGGFLTGITIDSVAIRDADNDSLLISSGRITANYDPRDLIDKRVWLRDVEVEHPVVYIRQHASGRWNVKEVFKAYDKKTNGPKAPGRSFGDFVVIDSARVHDATFVLQMPWTPDDSLRGATRDSAIRFTLARKDKEIRRVVDEGKAGFARTWRWTGAYAVVSRMRLADPDSDKLGKQWEVDTLNANETDPPFRFRNLRATVRNLGDTIWIDAPHFDLPASTGSAKGKIVWGSDLPVRYDIAVSGDSVSLADVSWVYPTLPTTGGGRVRLRILTEPTDLHVVDYQLTKMDVMSTASHLTGDMTFAVGGPVLVVKDVKLSAQPVDFELLRTLNGKPFPVDWRGQLYGSVRGRGGPLNRFEVDEGEALFRDAHVRGAVSRVGGHGELDILQPALTAFHGFDVNASSVDLRSIEFLFPNFPRLGGTIAGKATLDSSWLDVRFANADVVHTDGPGEPSRLTGSGRVTWGAQYMTYDVDLAAAPVSLTMLARSYPKLPLMGIMSGPVRARGTIGDLQLATSLQGPGGAFSFDGKVDIDPPGFVARGSGELNALALHALLDPSRLKSGSVRPAVITGRYNMELSGDSLANLDGVASVDISRADVDGLRVYPSRARLRFADRRVMVDTLRLETTAATVLAHGALGLTKGVSDSLHFDVVVDSLGGLRRYLTENASIADGESGAVDSLAGGLRLTGVAKGSVDSLDLGGALSGSGLYYSGTRGQSASGRFALRNVLADPAGAVTLHFDTMAVAGVMLDSADAAFQFEGRSHASFRIRANSNNGPTARFIGSAASTGGTLGARSAATRFSLDSLTIESGPHRWRLVGQTHVTQDSLGLVIDSLVVGNGAGGRVALRGAAPLTAPVALDFAADSLDLADVAALGQLPYSLGGFARLQGRVTGTRAQPLVALRSDVQSMAFGGMHVERATATVGYRDRSFDLALDLFRGKSPALHATASVPVDLTLFAVRRLDAPIRGSIRADSADLAIVEMLSPNLKNGSGKLTANLDIVASKTKKSINGMLAVKDGVLTLQSIGVTLRGINGGLRFDGARDSVQVNLDTWSGDNASSRLALRGFINYSNWDDPRFGLSLFTRSFRALDRRTLATLNVSTGADSLRLKGSMDAAALTGTLRVDRGTIYLPERDVARKQVVDLNNDVLFEIADTTDLRARQVLPSAGSKLLERLRLEDVRILIGDEVWLRSRAANIKLGGSLNVRSAPDQRGFSMGRNGAGSRPGAPTYVPALEGDLIAERGTYTLDLGPVQRDFDVQSGTIKFYGTADNNPNVDILATHNVKRAGQSDLIVRVHLAGPLSPNPTIDLASNETWLSPSDLVSYLVTGQPTGVLNSGQQTLVQQASNVLLPTLSSIAAQGLRNSIGTWVDVLQIQGGGSQLRDLNSTAAQQSFKDYFAGARLGGEKQITNNLFFSFSAGLCSLNRDYLTSVNQSAAAGFVDALGGKLEFRFNPQLSLQAGTEPPTSTLYCGRTGSIGSVVATPRQFGLSLLHTWHF